MTEQQILCRRMYQTTKVC